MGTGPWPKKSFRASLGEAGHYPGEHCPELTQGPRGPSAPARVLFQLSSCFSSRTAGQPLCRGDGDTGGVRDDVLPVPAKLEEQTLPQVRFLTWSTSS